MDCIYCKKNSISHSRVSTLRKACLAPMSGRAAEIKAEKGSKVFVDIFEFFVNFKQGFFCDVDSGREVP